MRICTLSLRHFRNVAFARLEFAGRRQFFLGANGQGKTNLLEAAGYITALRSFRTTDPAALRQHGQPHAAIACDLEHERLGETHVGITLHAGGKELWCDRERVRRLGDYLGRFPTVVFSSQDLQLVRGAPAGRRRWLDLTLAAMDAAYLQALQQYAKALAERNSLLKRPGAADAELAAFEEPLAASGAELIRRRAAGLEEIAAAARAAYARLTEAAEQPGFEYVPHFAEASADALRTRMESGRARDRQMRATMTGPHRDDVALKVAGAEAREFASEGQQRSLVLSLRLAQAAWFRERSGVHPVMLADDVLGELDPGRRRRFWAMLDPEVQVLATGTRPPEAELGPWQLFEVVNGAFEEAGGNRR